VSVLVVVLGGCGGGGSAKAGSSSTTVAVSTTLFKPQVEVDPAQGPIGTVFTFRLALMKPGSTIVFKVTGPNNHNFVGNGHPVGADGAVSAQYRATTGNPLGAYVVHATDNGGADIATGAFTVASAAATSGPPAVVTTPTTRFVTTRTTVRPPSTTRSTATALPTSTTR
jgi:hypothetical protein